MLRAPRFFAFAPARVLSALLALAAACIAAQTPPATAASRPAPAPVISAGPAPTSPSAGAGAPYIPTPPPMPRIPGTGEPLPGTLEYEMRMGMPAPGAFRMPTIFPPLPPALAEPLSSPHGQALARTVRLPFGPDFAETFYMPYASLLSQKLLSARRLERIQAYRDARDALLGALRDRLAATSGLPDPQRHVALAEFAAEQSGPLTDLEAEAESIRRDLTTDGFFRTSDPGVSLTMWANQFLPGPADTSRVYLQALLAAQFHDGLSTDQRWLLREIAMEHQLPFESSDDFVADYLYFQPATARIRIPAHPPAALAGKVARFSDAKSALKKELLAAIQRDDYFFAGERTEQYAALALDHGPRFAELDSLADEIRAELAGLSYPDAPARSDLSADLTRRVGRAVARKNELQRELSMRVRELRRDLPGDQVEIVRERDGLAIVVHPGVGGSVRRETALAELATFNAEMAVRFTPLTRELDSLREEIKRDAAAHHRLDRSVDELAAEFNASYTAQETWSRYRDYRTAALEPGLSPPQRRLLYRAALVDLARSR